MKDITPHQILLSVTVGISLLTALIFIGKNKGFSGLIKRFGLYIVIGAIFELYSYYLIFILKTEGNNLYLLHIFTLIEFVIIGFFFEKLFDLFDLKIAVRPFIFIGGLLIILNSLFIQPFEVYNSFSRTAVLLIFMGCCFVGFYLFTQRNYPLKDQAAVKLILIALLLKYSGSLFLYLFSNQIATLQIDIQKNIWLINPSLNFIAQAIVLIAFIGLISNVKKSENGQLEQGHF